MLAAAAGCGAGKGAALHRKHREIAASLNISPGAVGKIVGEAGKRGLTLDAVQGMSDDHRLTRPRQALAGN